MLIYRQISGLLLRDLPTGAVVLATCYSGQPGSTKNNPLAQNQKGLGPIVAGVYWVGEARDSDEHGPVFIPLIPVPGSEMYGRGSFGIHGERVKPPSGWASTGCIIAPRPVREGIVERGDKLLVVVSGIGC
jgi:hypothetical protein